jgi:phosphoglycerate dehydrogenase-like enzyme
MRELNILAAVQIHQPTLDALVRTPGIHIDVTPMFESPEVELSTELLRDKEVLFCSYLPKNFAAMKHVRWVQIDSAGYTQLFPFELAKRGIRATNGLGNFDVPIAEWNVAMMINLARDVRGMIRNQDSKVWDRDKRFQHEIRGSVVGLWGYGGMARETARLAKAMGLKVHALVRSDVAQRDEIYRVEGTGDPEGILPDRVFRSNEKDEFLRGLDFLILCMPLTNATEGLIGEDELQSLSRHAYLLNPARARIVQEAPLLRALREGWIAGAAIDVHYHYPLPADHPLWSMPNVILTPHVSGGGGAPHFLERLWDIFRQNIGRYLEGRPLLNELTSAQLSGG